MVNHRVENLRRGPWLEEEDERLTNIIAVLGERQWDALAKQSGLRRSGKSCRLRWMNYLRPNLKHGEITHEEEHIILCLHKQWGNKWARIARKLPGRTDNEIKNYWRSHLKKKTEAQQESFGGAMDNPNQDFLKPESDNTMMLSDNYNGESCKHEKDDIFGVSSFDAPNMNAFGSNSPYENRVLEWISCAWPHNNNYEQISEDFMGMYPCYCENYTSDLDYWSPIWGMH